MQPYSIWVSGSDRGLITLPSVLLSLCGGVILCVSSLLYCDLALLCDALSSLAVRSEVFALLQVFMAS